MQVHHSSSPADAALRKSIARVGAKLEDLLAELQQRPLVRPAVITDLAEPRLLLLQPIHVVLEQYEAEITASWPEVEAFGTGDSDGEALLALKQDIVSLYDDLSIAPDASLGPLLLAIKRVLIRSVDKYETP